MHSNNRTPVTRPVVFTRHYYTPEELASKTLSDCAVSSTVAHGPDDIIEGMYRFLLETVNKACIANQPDTVKRLTDIILENGLTRFMDISKKEIIIANTRATTLLDPTISIKDYYESLVNKYYTVID